jgi:hypothetical protein
MISIYVKPVAIHPGFDVGDPVGGGKPEMAVG